MALPRRHVAEIIEGYRLEPSLRDIYVEGHSDATIVRWYVRTLGIRDVKVAEIDSIEFPTELATSIVEGNRGRIMVLAQQVEAADLQPARAVLCIADLDSTGFLGTAENRPYLALTDHPSIETYLFVPDVLDKFVKLVLGLENPSGNEMVTALEPALRQLFVTN